MGLYENAIYAGVEEMLAQLKTKSYHLFVATSKPHVFAEKVIKHLSLADYFVALHGSDLEGRLDDKAILIAELIKRHCLDPEMTVMVGDRQHDVAAAKKNAVRSIGVTYGYGTRDELVQAGADYICDTTSGVVACIGDTALYKWQAVS